jgi:hypothetical protein
VLKVEVPEAEVDSAFAAAKQNLSDEAFKEELTRRRI